MHLHAIIWWHLLDYVIVLDCSEIQERLFLNSLGGLLRGDIWGMELIEIVILSYNSIARVLAIGAATCPQE